MGHALNTRDGASGLNVPVNYLTLNRLSVSENMHFVQQNKESCRLKGG